MSFETNTRFRINAEETAKGWRFNGTVEHKDDKYEIHEGNDDIGEVIKVPLGAKLYSMIHEAREEFKKKGEPLACEYVEKPKPKPVKKEIKS